MKAQRSPQVTPAMAAEIKAMLAQGLYNHQIAAHFGINQGRVSEVNTGKLHATVAPAVQLEMELPTPANDRGSD